MNNQQCTSAIFTNKESGLIFFTSRIKYQNEAKMEPREMYCRTREKELHFIFFRKSDFAIILSSFKFQDNLKTYSLISITLKWYLLDLQILNHQILLRNMIVPFFSALIWKQWFYSFKRYILQFFSNLFQYKMDFYLHIFVYIQIHNFIYIKIAVKTNI